VAANDECATAATREIAAFLTAVFAADDAATARGFEDVRRAAAGIFYMYTQEEVVRR
jgi:hypothetical protein